jgi:hypothetical protein
VLHVALYIRDCDREEIDAGMVRYDAAELAERMVAFSRFGCVAATEDGTPTAVLSAVETHPGAYQVGMFATQAWPLVALGLTRWIHRTMIPAMLAVGGHRAECRSIATHTEAHRWLESLGFACEAVLPDCGKGRETFHQYAWRLSDRDWMSRPLRNSDVQAGGLAIASVGTHSQMVLPDEHEHA